MHTTRTRQRRWQDHKHLTRSLIAGACLGMLVATGAMAAAPMAFPTATTTVKVDDVPLTGQGEQDQDQQLQNTVVYDNGTYYLWYPDGSKNLSDMTLAKSDDGVNFEKVGKVSVPDNWWTQIEGLTPVPEAQPQIEYPRLQKVGDKWIMAIWNANAVPAAKAYDYNTMLWDLGPSPATQAWTQIGPLQAAPTTPPTAPTDHLGVVSQ